MASVVKKCADSARIFGAHFSRLYCSSSKGSDSAKAPTGSPQPTKQETPKKVATESVSSDNTKYQAQEYYQHNELSFYDIDNDMASYRLPQQSKFAQQAPEK